MENRAVFSGRRLFVILLTAVLVTCLVTAQAARVGRANDPAGHHKATGDKGQIAFVSDRDGNNEIYVMAADGSNQINLTTSQADEASPEWSPDGSKIVYYSQVGSTASIYTMDADGSNRNELYSGYMSFLPAPSWSPNGTQLAMECLGEGSNPPDICVMDADGTNASHLTNSAAYDRWPTWSPDGASIAFERDDDIYVIDADGSNLRNLTASQEDEHQPVWSPRGDRITYERFVNGTTHICIMDADGSHQGVLVDQGISWCCPQAYTWSPDGSQIAYEERLEQGNVEISTVTLDEGVRQNVTNNAANDREPAWQPLGAVLYVKADPSGAMDCTSWQNACYLQDALAGAETDDEIWVAQGRHYPDQGADQTADDRRAAFRLKEGVALYGGFAGAETGRNERDWEAHVTVLSGDIDGDDMVDAHGVVTDTARIQGNNAYHVVVGSGVTGSALLDGFTVTAGATATSGGCPDECGAGMFNEGGSPTIRHLTFRGNMARIAGGGIYNDGGSPALTQVTFSDNDVAYWGGGMSNRNNSRPVLVNVTFSGNGGVAGGGMSNEQSAPTLTQVTFSRNWVQGPGGGMYNADSSPSLTWVAFEANATVLGSGGGMYNDNSHPSLTNVTFSGNHGGQDGGMSNQNSHPELTNVTFAGNVALGGGGGGMGNYNSSPTLINVTFASCGADPQSGSMVNEAGSNPTIQNSIFWHSCDSAGPGTARAAITNVDSLPSIAYSILEGAFAGGSWDASLGVDGGHNLDLAPLFARDPDPGPDGQWSYSTDNDYGDLQLQATSPAIDSGDNNALPADAIDLDGDGDLTEPCPLDLANIPRIVGGTIDLGAYEFARLLYLPLVVK
jgi:Tol biopolymer transport system component